MPVPFVFIPIKKRPHFCDRVRTHIITHRGVAGIIEPGHLLDSGWQTLTVVSPFSAGDPNRPLQIRRIAGVVYIRGIITRTTGFSTGSTRVAVVPVGFRPVTTGVVLNVGMEGNLFHSLLVESWSDISVRQTAASGA